MGLAITTSPGCSISFLLGAESATLTNQREPLCCPSQGCGIPSLPLPALKKSPMALGLQSLCPSTGAKCPTLKTAGKQPKKVPSGSQSNSRKIAGNIRKTVKTAVFRVFRFFRLFDWDPLGTFFGCFQCRAFGTPVDGHKQYRAELPGGGGSKRN